MIHAAAEGVFTLYILFERVCFMPQQHSLPRGLVVCIATLLIWMGIISDGPTSALAEDLAELSLPTPSLSQSAQEEAPTSPDLFLRLESNLTPDLPARTWSPAKLTKKTTRAEFATRQTVAPALSWEKKEQTGESLFINIQPHFTRDPVDTARSPFDRGESYQKSPLNSNDLIYGLGVATDYELAPWLHLNSSFRFNMHNDKSNPGSSAASPGDNTSHSLFFGVTVPFSTSPEK